MSSRLTSIHLAAVATTLPDARMTDYLDTSPTIYFTSFPGLKRRLPDMNLTTFAQHSTDSAEDIKHDRVSSDIAHTHYHTKAHGPPRSDSSSPVTPTSLTDGSSGTDMSNESSPSSISSHSAHAPVLDKSAVYENSPSAPTDKDALGNFAEHQGQSTPRKRPKNLKNLAVKTTAKAAEVVKPQLSALAPLPDFGGASAVHMRASPSTSAMSLQLPTQGGRRRPSNLSVITATPSSASSNTPQDITNSSQISSPNVARPAVLRHFQSSPLLPLSERQRSLTQESGAQTPMHARPSLERAHSASSPMREDTYGLPESREDKPGAYPDGPICVFDPLLDLYLEPTAAQARKYDVVINVASEVSNPFTTDASDELVDDQPRLDGGGGLQYAPKRDAIRATPSTANNLSAHSPDFMPEYIHIPWEHGSDIVPDLPRLVRLIDDRLMRDKRVLVHCQCGVSRSATLIVAYTMYKSPNSTVQEAYDRIKSRSMWIGPNMNLIMQLQEFRSNLMGKTSARRLTGGARGMTPVDTVAWRDWRRPTVHVGMAGSDDFPKTAPLLAVDSLSELIDEQHVSSAVTPGPSSAPSGVAWPITSDDVDDACRAASVPGPYAEDSDILPRSARKARPDSFRIDSHDSAQTSSHNTGADVKDDAASNRNSTQNFSLPLRSHNEGSPRL